jgi:hypothetical protein
LPDAAALGATAWSDLKRAPEVQRQLHALRAALRLTPAVAFSIDLVSRSEVDIVADLAPGAIQCSTGQNSAGTLWAWAQ